METEGAKRLTDFISWVDANIPPQHHFSAASSSRDLMPSVPSTIPFIGLDFLAFLLKIADISRPSGRSLDER